MIRFGFATNTYDADGEPLEEVYLQDRLVTALQARPERSRWSDPVPADSLSLDVLQKLAAEFRGLIQQVPPPFSAKKIRGVPAYKLARKQKEVVLQPVQIEISEFAITALEADRAHFRARVSSGTYMRSIAHEMGQRLGCGAHLASLRRTSVAEFDIAQAHTLEEIEMVMETKGCHSEARGKPAEESAGARREEKLALFIHPRQLLPQFPSVTADEPTAARIRSGRPINLPELSRARQVKVFASQTELLAIATRVAGTLFHPKIVFPA